MTKRKFQTSIFKMAKCGQVEFMGIKQKDSIHASKNSSKNRGFRPLFSTVRANMNKLGCLAVVFLMLGCSVPLKNYEWCGFKEDYGYVEFAPNAELRETLLGLVKLLAGAEPRKPDLWKIKNESEIIACEGDIGDSCGATIDHFSKRESGWEYDRSEFIQCHLKP